MSSSETYGYSDNKYRSWITGSAARFCNKSVNQSQSTVEFWKQVSVDKYPALRQTSQRLLGILGTTYSCESMYSAIKYVKSKNMAVLTNQHPKELLMTATKCYESDFKKWKHTNSLGREVLLYIFKIKQIDLIFYLFHYFKYSAR